MQAEDEGQEPASPAPVKGDSPEPRQQNGSSGGASASSDSPEDLASKPDVS